MKAIKLVWISVLVLVFVGLVAVPVSAKWVWCNGVNNDDVKQVMKEVCKAYFGEGVNCDDEQIIGDFWEPTKRHDIKGKSAGYRLKEGERIILDEANPNKKIGINVQCVDGVGRDNAFGGKSMKGTHVVVTEWELNPSTGKYDAYKGYSEGIKSSSDGKLYQARCNKKDCTLFKSVIDKIGILWGGKVMKGKSAMSAKIFEKINKENGLIKKGINEAVQRAIKSSVAIKWAARAVKITVKGAGAVISTPVPGVDAVMWGWTIGDLLTDANETTLEEMRLMTCGENFDELGAAAIFCVSYACPDIYEDCGNESNSCWDQSYYDCIDGYIENCVSGCNGNESCIEDCIAPDEYEESCSDDLLECIVSSSACDEKARECTKYCLLDKVLEYGENCKNTTTECGMIEDNLATSCGA